MKIQDVKNSRNLLHMDVLLGIHNMVCSGNNLCETLEAVCNALGSHGSLLVRLSFQQTSLPIQWYSFARLSAFCCFFQPQQRALHLVDMSQECVVGLWLLLQLVKYSPQAKELSQDNHEQATATIQREAIGIYGKAKLETNSNTKMIVLSLGPFQPRVFNMQLKVCCKATVL
eukprot:1554488-Amphidinium_carterae.1